MQQAAAAAAAAAAAGRHYQPPQAPGQYYQMMPHPTAAAPYPPTNAAYHFPPAGTAAAPPLATAAPVPASSSAPVPTSGIPPMAEWEALYATLRMETAVPTLLKSLDSLSKAALLSIKHSVYLVKNIHFAVALLAHADARVQERCAGFIANNLYGHFKETKEILGHFAIKMNGVRPLLELMAVGVQPPRATAAAAASSEPTRPAVQAEACRAIWNTVNLCPPVQTFVGVQCGAVAELVRILNHYLNLSPFAVDPHAAPSSIPSHLLTYHVVTHAIGALWALCFGSPEATAAAAKANAFHVLCQWLQRVVSLPVPAASAQAASTAATSLAESDPAIAFALSALASGAAERRLEYMLVTCMYTLFTQVQLTPPPAPPAGASAASVAAAAAAASTVGRLSIDKELLPTFLRLLHLPPPPAPAAAADSKTAESAFSAHPMVDAERAEVIAKALELLAVHCLHNDVKAQNEFEAATIPDPANPNATISGVQQLALTLTTAAHTSFRAYDIQEAVKAGKTAAPPTSAANSEFQALARTAIQVVIKKATLLVTSACNNNPANTKRFVALRGAETLFSLLLHPQASQVLELRLNVAAAIACVSCDNASLASEVMKRGVLQSIMQLPFMVKEISGTRQFNFLRVTLYTISGIARHSTEIQTELGTPKLLTRLLDIMSRPPTIDQIDIRLQVDASTALIALCTNNPVVQRRVVEVNGLDRLIAILKPISMPAPGAAAGAAGGAAAANTSTIRTRDVLLSAAAALQVLSASSPEVFQQLLQKDATVELNRVYQYMQKAQMQAQAQAQQQQQQRAAAAAAAAKSTPIAAASAAAPMK